MKISNQENLRQGPNQNPNLKKDYPNTPFLPSQNTPQQLGAINPELLKKLQNLKNMAVNTPPNPSNRFPNGNPAIFNQQNPQPQIPNQKASHPKHTFFSTQSLKSNSARIFKILGKKIEQTTKTAIQKYQKYQQDKKDDRNGYLLEQKANEMRKIFDED